MKHFRFIPLDYHPRRARRQAPPGDERVWVSSQQSARRLQYKWVDETKPFPLPAATDAGTLTGLINNALKELGYLQSMQGGHSGELFDLDQDPDERANLSEPEVILRSGSTKTLSRRGHPKRMESGAVNWFIRTLRSKLPCH